MAQELENHALPDPVLVTPQREASVIGRDVTLVWEPVAGAQTYAVQIARNPEFTDLVVEEFVGGETMLRLDNVLPEDRATYYWRVFARTGDVISPGEHIESFIALTPGEMEAAPATEPDLDEPLGPTAGLFKAAGAEMAAEVTGGSKAREVTDEMGVEMEGVEAAQILGITLAVMVALVVVIIFLFNWKAIVRDETYSHAVAMSGYPELAETEAAASRELSQYEVLNDAEGVYRVPIDRVITLMSNEAQTGRDTTVVEELPLFRGR